MSVNPLLNQLFNQAIQHTTSESIREHAAAGPIEEERRQFLENALAEVTYDVVKKMTEYVTTLNHEGATTEQIVEALEGLQFECEQIDASNDLANIGGVPPVLRVLTHADPAVRMNAAWVVGTTLQHNPEMQEKLLGMGAMELLLQRLAAEDAAEVQEKLLMAVSAFVRHHPGALRAFVHNEGYSRVLFLLASSSVRNRRKASFLLQRLLTPEDGPTHATGQNQGPIWAGVQAALEAEAAGEADADVARNLLGCVSLLAQVAPPPNVRALRAAVSATRDRLSGEDDIRQRSRTLLETLK